MLDGMPDVQPDAFLVQALEVGREGRQDKAAESLQMFVGPILLFGLGLTGDVGRFADGSESHTTDRTEADTLRKPPSIHTRTPN